MNDSRIEAMLLTSRQAAKALNVCEKTLYTLTKSGELPAVRIGRSVRYAVEDLRAFIERTKKNFTTGARNRLTML